MNLREISNHTKLLYGNKKAIICDNKEFSYFEIFKRIKRLTLSLNKLQLEPGSRIAIVHRNCHCFFESYYACMHAKLILCPINYRLASSEILSILKDAQVNVIITEPIFLLKIKDTLLKYKSTKVKVIITGKKSNKLNKDKSYLFYEDLCLTSNKILAANNNTELKKNIKAGRKLTDKIELNHNEKILLEESIKTDLEENIEANPEQIVQLYYTSGTTGRQKGVMLSHKNVYCHALSTISELNLNDKDVWLHAAPMFHLADAWATWAITWSGGTHTFVPAFDTETVLKTIQRDKVTITNMIPTMLNALINDKNIKKYDLSSLRVILSGGAPIAPEVVKKIMECFKCDYIQTYGLTETSPYVTMSILKNNLKQLNKEEQFKYKSSTGKPVIGINLKIIDDKGSPIPKDGKTAGEIIVKGNSVTKGYFNLKEETENAIKKGWLYTGDLANWNKEGYINIVDRKKDMIITGGENVYTTEVENILYKHKDILEAAVCGIKDQKWGEIVKAFIVLKKDSKVTKNDIINFCKRFLASYKSPKSIEFILEIPKTGSGKICKRLLKNEC